MTRPFKLKAWQPKETLIQSAILEALTYEIGLGRVCWANRMNSGAAKYEDANRRPRFVRFGFPGCPDIFGQLTDGRALYFEVKTATGTVTEYQQAFMDKALKHGAVGGIVRSADEAIRIVREAFKQ